MKDEDFKGDAGPRDDTQPRRQRSISTTISSTPKKNSPPTDRLLTKQSSWPEEIRHCSAIDENPSQNPKRRPSWQDKSLLGLVKDTHLTPEGLPQFERDFEALTHVLGSLVGFNTSSSHDPAKCHSNIELVSEIKRVFEGLGAEIKFSEEEYPPGSGIKHGSLVARIGPAKPGGILFCNHTDVIPADPEGWVIEDPFKLTEKDGNFYGRGTVDTKVNIAASLLTADLLAKTNEKGELEKPVYFAFSWGEEIGCMGTKNITELSEKLEATPELIVVGEPTEGKIVTGHKGGMNLNITIRGIGGHSSRPEMGINPIFPGAEVALYIRDLEGKLRSNEEYHNVAFDPPYPVVNPGFFHAGTTSNAIPETCHIHVHIRPTPELNQEKIENIIVKPIKEFLKLKECEMVEKAKDIARKQGKETPEEVSANFITLSYSRPLEVQPESSLLAEVTKVHQAVTGEKESVKTASFCSEAGGLHDYWAKERQKGIHPLVIVNGPGAMGQNAHRPNEYITPEQLTNAMRFPFALTKELCFNHQKECDEKKGEGKDIPGIVVIPTEVPVLQQGQTLPEPIGRGI